MNVWIFKAQANYTLVLGTDIEYFQDHFVAKPLADQWKPTHEDPEQESASSRFRILDDVSTSYF